MHDQVDFILSQWHCERPDLDPSPIGIIGRISRASRFIERRLEDDYVKFGLNGADFDVLATIRRSGRPYRLTPTELYRASMLSSGAMTNRLDRLEREGLIAREPNPADRRGILVKLTDAGLAAIENAMGSHVDFEAALLSGLEEEEQTQLALLLKKLLLSYGDHGPEEMNQ